MRTERIVASKKEGWNLLSCHYGAHQGLGTLNLDIFSIYLKLRVFWTVKSIIRQAMALDALRARFVPLIWNLDITNQPQQSDLRWEIFFSLIANLSLQFNGNWMRALPMKKDWTLAEEFFSPVAAFQGPPRSRLHVVWHVICHVVAFWKPFMPSLLPRDHVFGTVKSLKRPFMLYA
jgi:hypothetical protein